MSKKIRPNPSSIKYAKRTGRSSGELVECLYHGSKSMVTQKVRAAQEKNKANK